jgi:hypothetical protein
MCLPGRYLQQPSVHRQVVTGAVLRPMCVMALVLLALRYPATVHPELVATAEVCAVGYVWVWGVVKCTLQRSSRTSPGSFFVSLIVSIPKNNQSTITSPPWLKSCPESCRGHPIPAPLMHPPPPDHAHPSCLPHSLPLPQSPPPPLRTPHISFASPHAVFTHDDPPPPSPPLPPPLPHPPLSPLDLVSRGQRV